MDDPEQSDLHPRTDRGLGAERFTSSFFFEAFIRAIDQHEVVAATRHPDPPRCNGESGCKRV
jgi:hypothetical protein